MIPILDERVVTRTELVLVEEVRIHRNPSPYRDPQRVTLRKALVAVERFGEDGTPLPSQDRSSPSGRLLSRRRTNQSQAAFHQRASGVPP